MKTMFLFGAGADYDYVGCQGKDFILPLLNDSFKAERKALLGDNSRFSLIHPNSKKVFTQTVASFPEEAEKIFNHNIIDMCIDYESDSLSEDKRDELNKLCKEWYHNIINYSDNFEDKTSLFFLDHAVFFDILDEKFNHLRIVPTDNSGRRVINAYYTVFIMMLCRLYHTDSFEWTFDNIFALLRQKYNQPTHRDVSNSYYKTLQKLAAEDFYISTANYTNWVEIESKHCAFFLQGKMTWFEDYKTLRVYDVANESVMDTKTIIPFIMIPSGVKPIINPRQIREYAGFTDALDQCDFLCVVGYRFNSEDNHINSIISEWLKNKKHKLIVFNHNNSIDLQEQKWLEGYLIRQCKVNESFLANEQVIEISVSEDSNSVFESWIDELINHKEKNTMTASLSSQYP